MTSMIYMLQGNLGIKHFFEIDFKFDLVYLLYNNELFNCTNCCMLKCFFVRVEYAFWKKAWYINRFAEKSVHNIIVVNWNRSLLATRKRKLMKGEVSEGMKG